jgi:DnaJ-class molecular chaperone
MNEDLLKTLSRLAQLARDKKDEIAEKEEALKRANNDLRKLIEIDIPEAMREGQVQSIALEDGTKITVKPDVFASITAEMQDRAFAWLREHEMGGVIKHQVKADFGKNEGDAADKLLKFCEENNIPIADKETVHPQTLKALVKEQLEKGVDVPYDVFAIQAVTLAVIK